MEIFAALATGICPVIICLFLLVFLRTAFLAVREGIAHLKKLHQIPCDRCAFYTGEYRLKCTVRPYTAFTEEAIGCRDYEPASPLARCPVNCQNPIYKVPSHLEQ